jgi:hypothetical protein
MVSNANTLFAPGYEGRRLEKVQHVVETQVKIVEAGTKLLHATNAFAATHDSQDQIRSAERACIQSMAIQMRAAPICSSIDEQRAEEAARQFQEEKRLRKGA